MILYFVVNIVLTNWANPAFSFIYGTISEAGVNEKVKKFAADAQVIQFKIDHKKLKELPQMRRCSHHCCPGKILLMDEKTTIARVSWFCKSRGLASAQPDTSTLGDAS